MFGAEEGGYTGGADFVAPTSVDARAETISDKRRAVITKLELIAKEKYPSSNPDNMLISGWIQQLISGIREGKTVISVGNTVQLGNGSRGDGRTEGGVRSSFDNLHWALEDKYQVEGIKIDSESYAIRPIDLSDKARVEVSFSVSIVIDGEQESLVNQAQIEPNQSSVVEYTTPHIAEIGETVIANGRPLITPVEGLPPVLRVDLAEQNQSREVIIQKINEVLAEFSPQPTLDNIRTLVAAFREAGETPFFSASGSAYTGEIAAQQIEQYAGLAPYYSVREPTRNRIPSLVDFGGSEFRERIGRAIDRLEVKRTFEYSANNITEDVTQVTSFQDLIALFDTLKKFSDSIPFTEQRAETVPWNAWWVYSILSEIQTDLMIGKTDEAIKRAQTLPEQYGIRETIFRVEPRLTVQSGVQLIEAVKGMLSPPDSVEEPSNKEKARIDKAISDFIASREVTESAHYDLSNGSTMTGKSVFTFLREIHSRQDFNAVRDRLPPAVVKRIEPIFK